MTHYYDVILVGGGLQVPTFVGVKTNPTVADAGATWRAAENERT